MFYILAFSKALNVCGPLQINGDSVTILLPSETKDATFFTRAAEADRAAEKVCKGLITHCEVLAR